MAKKKNKVEPLYQKFFCGANSSFFQRISSKVLVRSCYPLHSDKRVSHYGLYPLANRFESDPVGNIKNATTNNKLDPSICSEFLEYFVSSSFLHLLDGWNYLGSSLRSLINGDIFHAIHLAYYAEVRAATALLGANGIGCFKRVNVFVWSDNDIRVIPNGFDTHAFLWKALESWGTQANQSFSILNNLYVANESIEDWLNAAGYISTNLLTSKWLLEWGLDLKSFKDDRYSRNLASYQPNFSDRISQVPGYSESIEALIALWNISEPGDKSRFTNLDILLLSLSLAFAYDSIGGSQKHPLDIPGKRNMKYRRFVNKTMSTLNISSANGLTDMLSDYEGSANAFPFRYVNKHTFGPKNTIIPLAVISRAFMLLRISSLFYEKAVSSSGVNFNSNSDYWKRIMEYNGLDVDISDISSNCDIYSIYKEMSYDYQEIKQLCKGNKLCCSDFINASVEHADCTGVEPSSSVFMKLSEAKNIFFWAVGS